MATARFVPVLRSDGSRSAKFGDLEHLEELVHRAIDFVPDRMLGAARQRKAMFSATVSESKSAPD